VKRANLKLTHVVSPTPEVTDDITAPLEDQSEEANKAVGTTDVGVKEGGDLGV